MRFLFRGALLLLAFLAALLARGSSTGMAIISAGRDYLESLAEGETETAHSLLTDSLAGMLSAEALNSLEEAGTGGIRSGRMEPRGFTLSAPSSLGGSRTLWLRRESGGEWRISGDTSLDNLLGRATVICSGFARSTVIPGTAAGTPPGDYACPVSGRPYFMDDGLLVCPSGHLGEGLQAGSNRCGMFRDSLASLVVEYVFTGHRYPSSFAEMFLESNGEFGQRGGFHCPDDGYAYYSITQDGIFCPYHGDTTRVGSVVADSTGENQE